MNRSIDIFPKALVTAARTFAKKPAVVGEILVALVAADAAAASKTPREGFSGKELSDVQRYVVAACLEEMAELAERRAMAAFRKRRQRQAAETAARSGSVGTNKGGK